MKKILILALCAVVSVSQLFSLEQTKRVSKDDQNFNVDLFSDETLEDSVNNFANTASSLSTSKAGYLAFTYEPISLKAAMINGNFNLIGPWGAEIGAGANFFKDEDGQSSAGFILEMDILNFLWKIPLGNICCLRVGAGVPFVFPLKQEIGMNPHLSVILDFFPTSSWGVSLSVEPGYSFDFDFKEKGVTEGFTLRLGLLMRMPGDNVANFVSQLMSGLSGAY